MKSRTKTAVPSLPGQQSPTNGAYPPISAQYWLPSANSTPYLMPGSFFVWYIILFL